MAFSPYTGRTVVPRRASEASWYETFESYADGALVGRSTGRSTATHVAVTSGALWAQQVIGSSATYMRGRVEKPANNGFRAVAVKDVDAGRVAWTEGGHQFRFYLRDYGGEGFDPGVKTFLRYMDEDNLYVASWRFDGRFMIQRKAGPPDAGAYQTLVSTLLGPPALGVWHILQFRAFGSLLTCTNTTTTLQATDGTHAAGTFGIRTDGCEPLLDSWQTAT